MTRRDGLDGREQERLRVEYFGLDRRQLDPLDHVDEDDVFDPQLQAWVPRKPGVVATIALLLLGAISGFILVAVLALVFGLTAPRSAQTTERVDVSALSSAGPNGAPLGSRVAAGTYLSVPASAESGLRSPSGAPSPDVELGTAMEGGVLAYADPGLGDRYLAIPSGPGHHVRICVGARCLDRTSTDAGPALFRQREGRIADVSFVDFAWLCRCHPPDVGLIAGSIEWLDSGQTPPPTDLEP